MGRKSAKSNLEVAAIAARQYGVASTWQMQGAGLTAKEILGRSRAGQIHLVHRGVYAIGHPGLSRRGRWMAAVLACHGIVDREGSAVLSHRSAAALWGILPETEDDRSHVLVAGRNGRERRSGIRVHWSTTLKPGDTTRHHGIPVTSPARTILDLQNSRRAERLSSGELRNALRQASVQGLSLGEGAESDRTRSELEYLFLRLCRRHGIPDPEVNVEVAGLEVDFVWRDRGLVVETDGYRFHRGRLAFDEDRRRGLQLRAHSFEVVRLTFGQVVDEPELVARMLRERLL